MTNLTAKKFTTEKFPAPGGYYMYTGDWGVVNEDGGWVAFAGNIYRPLGGRRSAQVVAETCNPDELEYIYPIGVAK